MKHNRRKRRGKLLIKLKKMRGNSLVNYNSKFVVKLNFFWVLRKLVGTFRIYLPKKLESFATIF